MKYEKKAHPFYTSSKWKQCRQAYLASKHYLCEICGRPANTVHHIEELQGDDYYNNPKKAFGEENLMAVCPTCHNIIHNRMNHGCQNIADGFYVDSSTGEIKATPPGEQKFLSAINRRGIGTKK